MAKLIHRDSELITLQKEYERTGSSFVVIYGRRRVGKTVLINEFCRNKKALLFLATEENERENRETFKNNVAEFCDDELVEYAAGNEEVWLV